MTSSPVRGDVTDLVSLRKLAVRRRQAGLGTVLSGLGWVATKMSEFEDANPKYPLKDNKERKTIGM